MSSSLNDTQSYGKTLPTREFDREIFFNYIRAKLFKRLSQSQVNGIEEILKAWEAGGGRDYRHLAYILATAFHETGKKMQPVREVGRGRGRTYGKADPRTNQVYYGRGHVQLTWYDNYKKMGELLKRDLLKNPDLALDCETSILILFEGMYQGVSKKGDFTKYSLEDYFNGDKEDPVGARRIVNGLDKADQIAGYYRVFKTALLEAGMDPRLIFTGGKLAIEMVNLITKQIAQDTGVPAVVVRNSVEEAVAKGKDDPAVQEAVREANPPPKPQIQSKTIWGAVAAMAAGAVAVYTGVELSVDETAAFTTGIAGAISMFGGVMSYIGRVRARRAVSGVVATKE